MTDPFVKAYQNISRPDWAEKIAPKVLAYMIKEEQRKQRVRSAFILIGSILLCGVLLLFAKPARAEVINIDRLANSIYMAEGGAKTRHPYGILKKYKTTTPRQACINTIKSALKRYEKSDKSLDFISFLGKTYCPVGASNDPSGLNRNWVSNVRYFYERGL